MSLETTTEDLDRREIDKAIYIGLCLSVIDSGFCFIGAIITNFEDNSMKPECQAYLGMSLFALLFIIIFQISFNLCSGMNKLYLLGPSFIFFLSAILNLLICPVRLTEDIHFATVSLMLNFVTLATLYLLKLYFEENPKTSTLRVWYGKNIIGCFVLFLSTSATLVLINRKRFSQCDIQTIIADILLGFMIVFLAIIFFSSILYQKYRIARTIALSPIPSVAYVILLISTFITHSTCTFQKSVDTSVAIAPRALFLVGTFFGFAMEVLVIYAFLGLRPVARPPIIPDSGSNNDSPTDQSALLKDHSSGITIPEPFGDSL